MCAFVIALEVCVHARPWCVRESSAAACVCTWPSRGSCVRSWSCDQGIVRVGCVEDGGSWNARIGRDILGAWCTRLSASCVPWRSWRLVPVFQGSWWVVGASTGL